jgi:hypothetical protein
MSDKSQSQKKRNNNQSSQTTNKSIDTKPSTKLSKENKTRDTATKIAIISLIISAFGIFGGVPGIISTFFSKPSLVIDGVMPTVVFDKGYSLDSEFPKFSLKALIKISNPNSYDISLNEMQLYGISRDTAGLKFPNGKTVIYEINVLGANDTGENIVKAYGTTYLKFKLAYFKNDEPRGAMTGPMSGSAAAILDKPDFKIFIPNYGQLFKNNQFRKPYDLVDELSNDELNFAINFNGKLMKVPSNLVLGLHHCSTEEWDNNTNLTNIFNAKKALK